MVPTLLLQKINDVSYMLQNGNTKFSCHVGKLKPFVSPSQETNLESLKESDQGIVFPDSSDSDFSVTYPTYGMAEVDDPVHDEPVVHGMAEIVDPVQDKPVQEPAGLRRSRRSIIPPVRYRDLYPQMGRVLCNICYFVDI